MLSRPSDYKKLWTQSFLIRHASGINNPASERGGT